MENPFGPLTFYLSPWVALIIFAVWMRERGVGGGEKRERDEESGYGDLCLCQTSSSIIIFESKVPREESNLKTSACLAFAITHLKIRSGIYLVYLGHCLLIFFPLFWQPDFFLYPIHILPLASGTRHLDQIFPRFPCFQTLDMTHTASDLTGYRIWKKRYKTYSFILQS